MYAGVVVVVLLACAVFAQYSLHPQAFIKFRVSSRLEPSGYSGYFYMDEASQVHAYMTDNSTDITYEYQSFMKDTALMYVTNEKCEIFTVPIPEVMYLVLASPIDFMQKQQVIKINEQEVLDNEIFTRRCIQDSSITMIKFDDNTPMIMCGQQENGLASHLVAERFTVELHTVNMKSIFDMNIPNKNKQCDHVKDTLPKQPPIPKQNDDVAPWFMDYDRSCLHGEIRHEYNCNRQMKNIVIPPGQTKRCVFLHGVGQFLIRKGPVSSEFTRYWGDIQKYTPQCSERFFIREETKTRGWNDVELQRTYCDVALGNSTDMIIRDTILFVHSMGNLILSAAIKNGYCDVDKNTTSWYQIMGPFAGTKAVTVLEDICEAAYSGQWPVTKAKLYRYIADYGGYCVPYTNHMHPAYFSLVPHYCTSISQECIDDLFTIAAERIKGSMCGVSPMGITSVLSPALKILSQIVGYSEYSDGLVPISSCTRTGSGKVFSYDYRNNWYLASVNHADGTCRYGDSYFGVSSSPCSYYKNKL
ncbi:hypothetical protein AKO1_000164 [Acrasis kona]|uniref:Uncharacterized protein n=1 Tax=Acrasis kona TaxID=1008807 RepID=A0AAW2ZS99_9EUKA